jgi:hypothetical protein
VGKGNTPTFNVTRETLASAICYIIVTSLLQEGVPKYTDWDHVDSRMPLELRMAALCLPMPEKFGDRGIKSRTKNPRLIVLDAVVASFLQQSIKRFV